MSHDIYLHVGYPKTGTTFLQNEVFPKGKSFNFISTLDIREELYQIRHRDEYTYDAAAIRRVIARRLKPGKNLISNEGLIGDFFYYKLINSRLIAERLKELFPDAKILITLRNQYDFLESLYRQYLHKGGTKNLRDFIHFSGTDFTLPYGSIGPAVTVDLLDYRGPIGEYARLFGADRVSILPFELIKKEGLQAFVKRVLLSMDSEEAIEFKESVYNPGYGATQASIARFLNRLVRSNYNEAAFIPDTTLPVTGKIDAGKVRLILQSEFSRKWLGQKPMNDEPLRLAIRDRFSIANRQLDEAYSVGLGRELPGVYYE